MDEQYECGDEGCPIDFGFNDVKEIPVDSNHAEEDGCGENGCPVDFGFNDVKQTHGDTNHANEEDACGENGCPVDFGVSDASVKISEVSIKEPEEDIMSYPPIISSHTLLNLTEPFANEQYEEKIRVSVAQSPAHTRQSLSRQSLSRASRSSRYSDSDFARSRLSERLSMNLPPQVGPEGMINYLAEEDDVDLLFDSPINDINDMLSEMTSEEIVSWTKNKFMDKVVLSTSFGIQSAVMLHLVTSIIPDIPVIWIDTGYLPKETYVFAESLIVRLNLNIQIYSPNITAARIDALFGKMWESGDPDMHKKYGYLTKVEPMRRAMADLNGRVTLAGLRADQTSLRENMKIINRVGKPTSLEEWKICPILRWSEQDIDDYMKKHNLPYHPLKAKGYATVGDAHSSRPVTKDDEGNVRATRFHGRAQECGLHLDVKISKGKLLAVDASHIEEATRLYSTQGIRVCMYTQANCQYCKASKKRLQKHNILYKEYVIGTDINAATLMERIGHTVSRVPQFFIDGIYSGGYNDLVTSIEGLQSTGSA